MNKKLYSLVLMLLAMTGFMSSCSNDDDIVFDHERQQFETRPDRILLEFIAPFGTTANEEIYIIGAFNGEDAAIGQEQYLLTKAPKSDVKFGIYLDPATFIDGKTLADGFRFYSVKNGAEYTTQGTLANHTDNPAVGSFTNIWGQRWESYYKTDEGDDDDEPEFYIPYLDSENEISVFFETPNEDTYYVWAWGDLGGGEAYTVAATWPGDEMTFVGNAANGNFVYKYVITVTDGIPGNLIISKNNGDEKIYDGVAFVNHGYYTEGSDTPIIITQVGKPAGGSSYYIPYLDSENEISVFFETANEDTYYVWVWGDLGGGEAYTVAATWPGDEMTFVGKTANGNFVYKYVITATDGIPGNLIISKNNGDEKIYDGVAFVNHGYYTEGSDEPTVITQVGKPAGGGKKGYEPTLASESEISVFFETPNEDTYYVWVWGDLGGGEAYTVAAAWPGDEMTYEGKTADGNFVCGYRHRRHPRQSDYLQEQW